VRTKLIHHSDNFGGKRQSGNGFLTYLQSYNPIECKNNIYIYIYSLEAKWLCHNNVVLNNNNNIKKLTNTELN
jgi:hypothetical protein